MGQSPAFFAFAISAFFALGVEHQASAGDGPYYVLIRNHVSRVNSPVGLSCEHWAAFYFHSHMAPTSPSYAWGQDDGNSPESVLKKQKDADQFDKTYANFFGQPYPLAKFGHHIFLAPVCITSSAIPYYTHDNIGIIHFESGLHLLQELSDAIERANALIRDADNDEASHFDQERNTLRQYVEFLKDRIEKANDVVSTIMGLTRAPIGSIERDMSDGSWADDGLSREEAALSKVSAFEAQLDSEIGCHKAGVVFFTEHGPGTRTYHYKKVCRKNGVESAYMCSGAGDGADLNEECELETQTKMVPEGSVSAGSGH